MKGRAARTIWWGIGVLLFFGYNTWVLWSPLNGNAAIFNGYLSELSASDQPNNLFFRGGDSLTALLVGALGVTALLRWHRQGRPDSRWWFVAAAGLILFGVSTFLDAFFAMDCSPTLSTQCKVLEETHQLSTIHYAHIFTSVGAQAGIVASMIAAYLGARQSAVVGRVMRRFLLLLASLEVAALTVMMIMLAAGIPGLGYLQAVMVVLAAGWFSVVAFSTARTSRPWAEHDVALSAIAEPGTVREGEHAG